MDEFGWKVIDSEVSRKQVGKRRKTKSEIGR